MGSEKQTRWFTLGANLAVLAGIILILIELNQNADLMRSQIVQSRGEGLEARYIEIGHSDYGPAIAVKRDMAESGSDWFASLSPEERVRVRFSVLASTASIRSQYYQYQQGYLDEAVWAQSTRDQIVRALRDIPYFVPDLVLPAELVNEFNRIADEEGLPRIGDSKNEGPQE